MARPRTVSDAQLIGAAARAIVARGDGSWSLADAAHEAGITPAALVKRFGSKAGLLRALAEDWADAVQPYDAAQVADPLAHLQSWVKTWLDAADPRFAIGHLTLLLDELADDDTRSAVARGRDAQRAHIDDALTDARRRALLSVDPPPDVALIWLDVLAGSVISAAIQQSPAAAQRTIVFIIDQIDTWRTPL